MDPLEQYIDEYIQSLSEQEQLVLNIAREHLESSFNLIKSNGFLEWVKKTKTM
jgi:hypothetical protein